MAIIMSRKAFLNNLVWYGVNFLSQILVGVVVRRAMNLRFDKVSSDMFYFSKSLIDSMTIFDFGLINTIGFLILESRSNSKRVFELYKNSVRASFLIPVLIGSLSAIFLAIKYNFENIQFILFAIVWFVLGLFNYYLLQASLGKSRLQNKDDKSIRNISIPFKISLIISAILIYIEVPLICVVIPVIIGTALAFFYVYESKIGLGLVNADIIAANRKVIGLSWIHNITAKIGKNLDVLIIGFSSVTSGNILVFTNQLTFPALFIGIYQQFMQPFKLNIRAYIESADYQKMNLLLIGNNIVSVLIFFILIKYNKFMMIIIGNASIVEQSLINLIALLTFLNIQRALLSVIGGVAIIVEDWWSGIVQLTTNLLLSLIFWNYYGLEGLVLASILAIFITNIVWKSLYYSFRLPAFKRGFRLNLLFIISFLFFVLFRGF